MPKIPKDLFVSKWNFELQTRHGPFRTYTNTSRDFKLHITFGVGQAQRLDNLQFITAQESSVPLLRTNGLEHPTVCTTNRTKIAVGTTGARYRFFWLNTEFTVGMVTRLAVNRAYLFMYNEGFTRVELGLEFDRIMPPILELDNTAALLAGPEWWPMDLYWSALTT